MRPTREKGFAYLRKVLSANTSVSKFYDAGESWTKSPVWWFDIPIKKVKDESFKMFFLLCQKSPTSEDFYILAIPKRVFNENMSEFEISEEEIIRLHLSAESHNIFTDIRGQNFDFSKFCINQP